MSRNDKINYQRAYIKSLIEEDIKNKNLNISLCETKIELLCDIIMNDDKVWSGIDCNLNETFTSINSEGII